MSARGLGRVSSTSTKNHLLSGTGNKWFCKSGYQLALLAGLHLWGYVLSMKTLTCMRFENLMPEIKLSDLYAEMQKEMLQKLQTGAFSLVHSGSKGDNTEANWIEWFRAYLPERYKVDNAIIIASTGKKSQQIDLVIYDAQYSYLVFHQGNTKLIPAESVYAVFKVKQELNKEYIEYAGEKAKSVRSLHRASARIKHAGGNYDPKPLHEVLAGVLTTRSTWASPISSNVKQFLLLMF